MKRRAARACIRLCSLAVAAFVAGCVHVAPLRVYPDDVPADSLRLVQTLMVGSRADILESKDWHQALLASGIPDSEIRDGSMGVGRIYCCGGPAEVPNRQAYYIPPGLSVGPFDVVEVRAGREPDGRGGPTRANVVTRVVQTKEAAVRNCRWVPEDNRLWMRVLYCDWMPAEGWIEQKTTLTHTWLKPPPGYSPK
jgi:hypothetical protein